MATFTITTPVNIDSLAGKTGGDTYTVNGGYLTIDQDSRYGTNQTTSSILGNIGLSATRGGSVEFNATLVRLIPFDGGAGVVPAAGTAISGSTGSGSLLAVYSSLASAPTAAAAAMPATGFIKIRQWDSVPFTDNDALSGITATVNGTDRVGWLEIVGQDAGTITVNRLNLCKVRGLWFDLGTTDGNRSTTYQIPSNGANVYLPGVWVESAPGSDEWEFYSCVNGHVSGSLLATSAMIATDEIRGRVCWVNLSGELSFGYDGTNSTGGFCPEAGRGIRMPNIRFTSASSAARTVNIVPHATVTSRYEFATTGGGVIDIDGGSFNWYLNFSQPSSVSLQNVSTLSPVTLSECATAAVFTDVGISVINAPASVPFTSTLCFAGGTFTRCVFARLTQTGSNYYCTTLTSVTNYHFVECHHRSFEDIRGSTNTGSMVLSRVTQSSWTNCLLGGGKTSIITCAGLTFTNSTYFDNSIGTTITTTSHYAWEMSNVSTDVMIDGLSFGGLWLVQPLSGLLLVGAAGCENITLRNIGTYASPLDLGGPREDFVAWTRVTTTVTVTKVAHGLQAGDRVYVPVSSVTAAVVVGLKTVIAAPTADTFTFTGVNSGATSGTLSYFPAVCAYVAVLSTGAAARNIRMQRCYVPHTRTNLYSVDNSTSGFLLENVYSDFLNAFTSPQLNGTFRGVTGTPTLAAQVSCYGTHWFGNYVADVTPTTAGVAWTRVTTTATVTAPNHGLRTGLFINVLVSSATATIPLGQKTLTVIDADTFTFTCTNAGVTSGTLDFSSFLSRVGVLMNESTVETASQYTVDAGTPQFTSAGSVAMFAIGDQITWEHPEYVKGHVGFEIAEPVIAGGTINNHDFFYAIDKNDGSGFGAYKNLRYTRTGAGGTNGSTNVTMTDTSGVSPGDYIFGTNIYPNSTVVSITDGTTIVVSSPNTGTVSGTLRFNAAPNETMDPDLGFKLRLRIVTVIANTLAITYAYVWTVSTVLSRSYQYPLDLGTLEVTGLKNPTEVRVFEAGTTNEIVGTGSEAVTSGTFTAVFDTGAYPSVDIAVLSLGYQNTRLLAVDVSSGDVSIPVQQQIDRQYENP